jgi:DNA-binding IclR family transcriptional regulator
VAAPVRDSAGAVSVVAVASRVGPGDIDTLVTVVLCSAAALSEKLALVTR